MGRSKKKNPRKKTILYNDEGKEICGSKRPNRDELCQVPEPLLMQGGRCRSHGGASQVGIEHHNFKSGKYSKVLPRNINEKYQEAIADPKILELRSEIALAEARRQDLMEQFNEVNHKKLGKALRMVLTQTRDKLKKGETVNVEKMIERLLILTDLVVENDITWAQIMEVEDHKRKLIEGEHKRAEALGNVLTSQGSLALIMAMVKLVRDNVPDQSARRNIQRGLKEMQG